MLTAQIEETLHRHAGTIKKFAKQPEIIMTLAPLLAEGVQSLLDDVKRAEAEAKAAIDAVKIDSEALRAKITQFEVERARALSEPVKLPQTVIDEIRTLKEANREMQEALEFQKVALASICKRCKKKIFPSQGEEGEL